MARGSVHASLPYFSFRLTSTAGASRLTRYGIFSADACGRRLWEPPKLSRRAVLQRELWPDACDALQPTRLQHGGEPFIIRVGGKTCLRLPKQRFAWREPSHPTQIDMKCRCRVILAANQRRPRSLRGEGFREPPIFRVATLRGLEQKQFSRGAVVEGRHASTVQPAACRS
jgi:hypothetical protein